MQGRGLKVPGVTVVLPNSGTKEPETAYIVSVREWCLPYGVVRDLKETVSALG